MYCGNCGKFNNDNAAYCKYCGNKIKTDNTIGVSQPNSISQNNKPDIEDKTQYNDNFNAAANSQYNQGNQKFNQEHNQVAYINSNPHNIPQNGNAFSQNNFNNRYVPRDAASRNQQYNYGAQYVNTRPAAEPDDGYDKVVASDKKKSSTAVIVIALISFLVVVLVALAIAGIFIYNSGKSNGDINFNFPQNDVSSVFSPTTTTVAPIDDSNEVYIPAVTGFSYSDAITKLNEKNLQSRVTAEYSTDIPENCIIRQSPQSGEKASEGDVVTIVLSKGVYSTPDYDYYGIPYSARSESGYIFSQSHSRYLTKSDVAGLNDAALQMGINEIYARRNVRFGAAGVKKYFNSKSWYIGYIDLDDFDDSVFNEYESANIEFLQNAQKALKNSSSSQASSKSSSNSSSSSKSSSASNSSSKQTASSNSDDYVPIFTEIEASSELVSSKGTVYEAQNVCYDDNNCWAEGVEGTGNGEWIMYTAKKEQKVSGVEIINGFAKSAKLYNQNAKVKKVRLEFSDGSSYTADLTVRNNATNSNYRTSDYIDLPHTVSTTYIKVVIVEAVEGTEYDDTCITLIAPY